MAEIKIEKKKPIWPWIALILIIGALVCFMLVGDNDTQSENTMEIENTNVQ
ncbi:hypothetical protein [Flavobacterium agrisoli]|uniref:Uncharacterized protein n=1 Tax=Flavobacterium agrisoli TaxID=2793066 RepID=A0A934PKY3_9FLAO|nr:hypothetical protein [Flavobacterium agrisoli]MBK0368263.1 hypothetical protein [Flavobacterium agrisoli]